MERLLSLIKAMADPTRLRLLNLCARSDLAVVDLTSILAQSQPRLSRHLKILSQAGLLERRSEGQRGYFSLTSEPKIRDFAKQILSDIPSDDKVLERDNERLAALLAARAKLADNYFDKHARNWHQVRSLYNDDSESENLFIAQLKKQQPIARYLDCGTGTGRMLQLAAPFVAQALGVDNSREMLTIARATLDKNDIQNALVQEADLYALPFQAQSFDAIGFYQVLHFLENPQLAIAQAAQVLKPQGRLYVLDYNQHNKQELAREYAHVWLGFDDAELREWLAQAKLEWQEKIITRQAQPQVNLWIAQKP